MPEQLSQAQIDALLKKMSSGEVAVEEKQTIKEYDFKSPKKFTKEQLKAMDGLHETFSRLLSSYLSGILRIGCDVQVLQIDEERYYEYNNALPDTALIGIVGMDPEGEDYSEGTMIIDVSTTMGFYLVDRLLGGSGDDFNFTRDYTEIEMAIIHTIFKEIVEKLEDSCPEKTFSHSCYASNYYDPPLKFDLYSHQTQVAPFYFSKPVKWGRNFFYSCSDRGQDTFFCSETASRLMLQHGLEGMEFLPVLSKKTNEPMPDIYQFNVTTMIPDSSFHVVGASGIWTCPVCGKSRYVVNSLSRPSVDKSVLGEQDFYVTDMIQTYNGPCFPSPFYIVSKKACDFFRKYRFDRTLELFPLLTY